MELKLEIFQQMEKERILKQRERNARKYSAKVNVEKEKTKLALSIIGGAIACLPILYGMLFLITIV